MGKRLTLSYVKESFAKEDYILLNDTYINARHKLDYTCSNGHTHSITWGNWHLGCRCPICSGVSSPSIEKIKEKFLLEGYRLLSTEYVNAHSRLMYICPNNHIDSISMANWNLGYRCKKCHIDKIKGSGNNAWKGGITPLIKQIRNYIRDMKWHIKVLTRDNCTCNICGFVGYKGYRLHAHHIVPFADLIQLYDINSLEKAMACKELLDISNGITLCESCHKKVHRYKNKKFDERGYING